MDYLLEWVECLRDTDFALRRRSYLWWADGYPGDREYVNAHGLGVGILLTLLESLEDLEGLPPL